VSLAAGISQEQARARRAADLALLGVTFFWASSFALIKGAMGEVSPILFIGIRFALACAVLWPLLRGVEAPGRAWREGCALGVLLFGCFATQVTGLRYTTAGNSAFVTATCSVMVPFVDYALCGRRPRATTLVGVLIAMAGVYLLVNPEAGRWNRGDLWTLGCAALYAVYIVKLDGALRRGPYQVVLYAQLAVAGLLGFAISPLVETPHLTLSWNALRAIAIVSLGATAAALYLQNRYQARTTPTRAALVFLAEPVFAAGFAYLLLEETLLWRGYVGAGLIIGGILLSELL